MSQHQYIQQNQGANGTQSPNRYNQQGVAPSVVISPSAPVSEGCQQHINTKVLTKRSTSLLPAPPKPCLTI